MFLRTLSKQVHLFPRVSYVQACWLRLYNKDVNDNQYKARGKTVQEVMEERAKEFMDNLDDELKERKKNLEHMMEQWRFENRLVPEHISALDMKIMLTETSGSRKAMQKYCSRLCKKNNASMNKKKQRKERKQEERRKQVEERVGDGLDDHNISIHYARRQTFEKQWQKIRTLLHGHPVIIDLNYDLKIREEHRVQDEFETFHGWNLSRLNPLLLQFTSVHRNSLFSSLVDSKSSNNIAAEFYQEHFTELHPKDNLVYLSSDGERCNRSFDRNKIYIIGGCDDKYSYNMPRESYIKARELGIECRSFPVHPYFQLGKKQKNASFPIGVSLKILQKAMVTGDWKTALQAHISGTFEPKIDKPSQPSKILQLLQNS